MPGTYKLTASMSADDMLAWMSDQANSVVKQKTAQELAEETAEEVIVETTEETITNIKIVEMTEDTLELDFNGEIRKFEKYEQKN